MNFFNLTTFVVILYITSSVYSREIEHRKIGRIIGGTAARAGEFPFAAAISIHKPDGQYFCGGALLNAQWILTAAQCTSGAISFVISLGSNLIKGTDPNRVTASADIHFEHPKFDPDTLQNDIALIKLRLPVTFSDYLAPIHLPPMALPDYSVVVSVGWGQTSDDVAGTVTDLNRVTLTAFTNAECKLTYGSQIIDEMVCAEGNFNQGTCHGDSGGPLVRYLERNQIILVAVASFFSGNGCESTDPSGFTRTFPYLDWIRATMGNSSLTV